MHLRQKNIPFHLELGYAVDKLPALCAQHNPCAIVADMSPLRVPMDWVKQVADKMNEQSIPVYQVCAIVSSPLS
jgi:deoxyribodipyrimidine photo-lyase